MWAIDANKIYKLEQKKKKLEEKALRKIEKSKVKKKTQKVNKRMKKENVELAKTIAKIRDGYICQKCWKTENIHWSHVINEARDHRLSCDPENIKALCYNCHLNRRHKNPVEAGERFKEKRPWRRENLKCKHLDNRFLGTISPIWVEEQNKLLKETLQSMEEPCQNKSESKKKN